MHPDSRLMSTGVLAQVRPARVVSLDRGYLEASERRKHDAEQSHAGIQVEHFPAFGNEIGNREHELRQQVSVPLEERFGVTLQDANGSAAACDHTEAVPHF